MIKYYDLYFQNFFGSDVSVDIEVDISDVCDYMSCSIISLNEDIIRAYIIQLFKCCRPNDTFFAVVPLDYMDCNSLTVPFNEFLCCPKAWY